MAADVAREVVKRLDEMRVAERADSDVCVVVQAVWDMKGADRNEPVISTWSILIPFTTRGDYTVTYLGGDDVNPITGRLREDVVPVARFASRDDAMLFVELKAKHVTRSSLRQAMSMAVMLCCKHEDDDDDNLVVGPAVDRCKVWRKGVLLTLFPRPTDPARVSDPDESDGTVAECIQTACRLGDGVVSARANGIVRLYG
jgi:hypothetical protein